MLASSSEWEAARVFDPVWTASSREFAGTVTMRTTALYPLSYPCFQAICVCGGGVVKGGNGVNKPHKFETISSAHIQ
jgi:hypothetical protein